MNIYFYFWQDVIRKKDSLLYTLALLSLTVFQIVCCMIQHINCQVLVALWQSVVQYCLLSANLMIRQRFNLLNNWAKPSGSVGEWREGSGKGQLSFILSHWLLRKRNWVGYLLSFWHMTPEREHWRTHKNPFVLCSYNPMFTHALPHTNCFMSACLENQHSGSFDSSVNHQHAGGVKNGISEQCSNFSLVCCIYFHSNIFWQSN